MLNTISTTLVSFTESDTIEMSTLTNLFINVLDLMIQYSEFTTRECVEIFTRGRKFAMSAAYNRATQR